MFLECNIDLSKKVSSSKKEPWHILRVNVSEVALKSQITEGNAKVK